MKALDKSFRGPNITSAERKRFPIYSGVLAYFPDALARVAEVSFMGNEKHNPGQPLHWSRQKSADHKDCAARHLIQSQWEDLTEQGAEDHLAEAAWRILAALQIREEQRYTLDAPDNAVDDGPRVNPVTAPVTNGNGDFGAGEHGC